MKIDTSKLKETYLRGAVPLAAYNERFYVVPNADNYALSTYGRLYDLTTNHRVKPTFIPHTGETYSIRWNDGTESIISIEQLIALVFFNAQDNLRIGQPHFSNEKLRWKVEDLHLLYGKRQYVEYLLSKIRHREAKYSESRKHHEYVNNMNLSRHQAALIYQNVKGRALCENTKKIKPHYANTTMAQNLIDNPNEFYRWLLANQYYHPLGLELDKDIMTFGKSDEYAIGKMALVPRYINDFFRETTSELGYGIKLITKKDTKYFTVRNNERKQIECNSYDEALRLGRIFKAEKIKSMVAKEKALGYMPSHILRAMRKWATLCKNGKIKMWEPDAKIKKEMREINNV